jgi:ABC-type multidrug transport system ATPase subunit
MIFLGAAAETIRSIVLYLIVSFGYWKIFEKCGLKGYWGFVPLVREYNISLCANREEEGRTYTVIMAVSYLASVFNFFRPENLVLQLIIAVSIIALFITLVIYKVRIYLGLIKVFDRKKRWIWLFVLFEALAVLIFGVSSKFVPNRKVTNYSLLDSARISGIQAGSIENGLTVNIEKRTAFDFFRKKILLQDIHLNIPKGHMVLLLGGSGAGKTTFLNAVTGYEKADASIKLDGEDVYEEYTKMMYDIGFVPQQDLIRGNDAVQLTLEDAATLRLPSKVNLIERKKRVKEVLDEFGLQSLKNTLVEKLSGGQRKRLSIAMEYISDPKLFILDEPDSGLDGVVARGLFERLRAIADQGKIVIVITHTPDRVIDLFDDVIVLAKDAKRTGRLAWYGPVDEAYSFFGKDSMEGILLSINQKDEGGEGLADEFVEKFAEYHKEKVG